MINVLMLSDRWLSRCGLLENFNTEILLYEDVPDFDLQSNPLEWTLGSDVIE